jgi:hypothetical protein
MEIRMAAQDRLTGTLARWREHRRAKRQEAREREFFDRERARSAGTDADGYQHAAPTAGLIGFGDGDGGGGGGDGGGGGG